MTRRIILAVAVALTVARAQAQPSLTVDLGHPGRTVPREAFGSNLPARSEATPRIITLMKDLGISLFRYPGGDSPGWHWQTGSFDFPVTASDASCTLTRPQPVLDFAAAAGGEVLFMTNVESGSAAEAGALAAAMGSRVRFYEVGNEVFGDWDRGYRSVTRYAGDVQAYARAIHAAAAGARVGADMAGEYRDTDNDGDGVDTADWDRRLLAAAGADIDFLSWHWYPGRRASEEPLHVMAGSLRIPHDVTRFQQLARAAVGHEIDVGYLEWDGVFDNDSTGMRATLANALFYADALGQMAEAGVALATHYDTTTRSYGIVRAYDACQGGTPWDGQAVRPKGYALALASHLGGGRLLPTQLTGSGTYQATTTSPLQEYAGTVPYLGAYAARTSTGLALLIVHRHPDQPATLAVHLGGAASGSASATVATLTGPSLTANNESAPGTVALTHATQQLALPDFTLTVPPRALLLVELPLAAPPVTSADAGTSTPDAADAAPAAAPDAAAPAPDATVDATPDGGTSPSPPALTPAAQPGSGCGCQTTGARGAPLLLIVLALGLAWRRR